MSRDVLALAAVGVLLVAGLAWARRGRADDGVPPRLAAWIAREAVSVRRRRQTAAGVLTAVLLTGSALLRALALAARVGDLALERAAGDVDRVDEPDVMGMPARLRRWRHSPEFKEISYSTEERDL